MDCTQLDAFIAYCAEQSGRQFESYEDFERFAIDQFRAFWQLFLRWSAVVYAGEIEPVCDSDDCEAAVFFPQVRLNYAENLLTGPGNALIGCHADGNSTILSRATLRDMVVRFALHLRQLGVEPGDRVAAIARNNVEVIVGALASAAIGAVFTSCAHDMGAFTILSRFQRLDPKVLVTNVAAKPGDIGKPLPEKIDEIVAGLPSLAAIVTLDGQLSTDVPVTSFDDALAHDGSDFVWQRFAFNHPLFILFSSGTTGAPKCIIHGTGGTLLEHLKEHRLHGNLSNRDRMFFQTTCGWMMWNWQLSALACGAEVVVYDGPLQGPETLWELIANQRVTCFGTNPAYLQFTESAGFSPDSLNLSALRCIYSTGSILYPRQFDWVAKHVKAIPVQSISGGTDIIGCFLLGHPLRPVHRGQAQSRSLGMDVQALCHGDSPIGELICANPFPSRPTGFYGESSSQRYHDAYYAQNPGVWTHGDLIEMTPENGAIIHGRSDGVMNIRGVRVGPAEIYRILQQIPSIVEAMAVEQTSVTEVGGTRLVLLVVLRNGVALDAALVARIRGLLADQGSSAMVPAMILPVRELPVTHSGKRSEAAARDAVNGREIRNRTALLNPDCLDGLAGKATPGPLPNTTLDGDLEANLCAIAKRYLNVEVKPTDNFLSLGGDSLAILGFLMAVSDATKTSVPLPSLIGVSTIKALVELLSTGVSHSYINGSAPKVRVMEPGDEEQICRLLNEGFDGKMPWQRIFEHPWQPNDAPRGFVIDAADGIVGFLGLICAERTLNGKSDMIGNLTSWYVRREYRGWSNALIAATTQLDMTYTSLTPGRVSRRILLAMGFDLLDTTALYLPPSLPLKRQSNILLDKEMIRLRLSGPERRILDDHAHCECLPLLVTDSNEMALALIVRRLYRPRNVAMWPYSQLLYCSAPHVLKRNLLQVATTVTRHQRTIGLTIGQHMLPAHGGIHLPARTMFRSGTFVASDLDKLYSELTLLPI